MSKHPPKTCIFCLCLHEPLLHLLATIDNTNKNGPSRTCQCKLDSSRCTVQCAGNVESPLMDAQRHSRHALRAPKINGKPNVRCANKATVLPPNISHSLSIIMMAPAKPRESHALSLTSVLSQQAKKLSPRHNDYVQRIIRTVCDSQTDINQSSAQNQPTKQSTSP